MKCPCLPEWHDRRWCCKSRRSILSLSGYDRATGAARKHAIQHVGLPAEIGVIQAHRALFNTEIRKRLSYGAMVA